MGDFNGHRLAYALSPPAGGATYYAYDDNGNLTSVGSPQNNRFKRESVLSIGTTCVGSLI
jgi:YD repeat-containing protein